MVLAAALWDWHGVPVRRRPLLRGGPAAHRRRRRVAADHPKPKVRPRARRATPKVGLDLLLSAPILRNLLFFFCLAMANGGIQTHSVVGLGAIHGTPASVANIALSGFLLFSAAGVLLGGIIADRTPHHERWRRWFSPARRPWRS